MNDTDNTDGEPPRDRTVAEWMEHRARDDGEDAAWHARAGALFAAYLPAHGFQVQVSASHGTGVPETAIELYERARGDTVPEELLDIWRRVGSATWTVGGHSLRILSPGDMLTRGQVPFGGHHAHVDVFIADENDHPVVVFAPDRIEERDRRFARLADERRSFGKIDWRDGMWWLLGHRFNLRMVRAIRAACPEVHALYHGMKLDPSVSWRTFRTPDRVWGVYADEGNGVLATRSGIPGGEMRYSSKRMPPEQVAKKAASAVAAKVKAGFVEVS